MDKDQLEHIQTLLARLERISADSIWAHRASGVRGSLIEIQQKLEIGETTSSSELIRLLEMGFDILERAAKEMIR